MRRRGVLLAVPFVTLCAWFALPHPIARAAGDTTVGAPVSCAIVDREIAGTILGFEVSGPDERALASGVCAYSSTSATQDGNVSYAIVNADLLPRRRATFFGYALRCRGVEARSPRYRECMSYFELSRVPDIASYYAARTAVASTPAPSASDDAPPAATTLGDASAEVSGSIVVKRGDVVYECTVRRNGDFDRDRSIALAKALLANAR